MIPLLDRIATAPLWQFFAIYLLGMIAILIWCRFIDLLFAKHEIEG